MFIDHFARGFMRFVNWFAGAAIVSATVAVFLRPDPAGPQKYMLGFVAAFYLLVAGAICLARPRVIQEYMMQKHSRDPRRQAASRFAAFVRTDRYILFLRACGGAAWLLLGLLVFAFRSRL